MSGVALVTGASSGIGREFARLLAEQGYDLVLVSRREERLRALAADLEARHGAKSLVIGADLGDADAPDAVRARVEEAGLEVDVLVNNAGATPEDRLLDRPWEAHAGVVNLMAVAPVHLVYAFLPGMLERRRGHVINVVSVGAWYPSTPTQTLYGATKAFALRFTQTLSDEYPDRGVTFTALCPGVTRTEILDIPVIAESVKGIPDFLVDSPRKVAERGWKGALSGREVVVVGITGKLVRVIFGLLPERVGRRMIADGLLKAYKANELRSHGGG